ncbi:MAG: cyclic nucleotide-binding domain-containing protein [Desulfarculus sp.]|nr:cyclic nucleotide-binding domain-containing protein [Desulfarculus sp.]
MHNGSKALFPVKLYHEGSLIFRQGGPPTFGGIIQSGRVAVIKEVEGEEIVLCSLGRGAIVGEMALISDMPRTASVVALEDTELVVMDRAKLKEAVASGSVLLQAIITGLVERLSQTSERVRLQRGLPDLCLALANLLQACLDDNPADSQGQVSIPLPRLVEYSRATLRATPADLEEVLATLVKSELITVGQGPEGRELRLSKAGNVVHKTAQMLAPLAESSRPEQPPPSLAAPQRRQADKYISIYELAANLNTTPPSLCRMLQKGDLPETMVYFPRQEAMRWAEGLKLPPAQPVPEQPAPPAQPAASASGQECPSPSEAPSLLEMLMREHQDLLARALGLMDQANLLVLLSGASPASRLTLWQYLEPPVTRELQAMLEHSAAPGPTRFAGAVNVLRRGIIKLIG